MGEIAMMPEGLVKISSSLYETILPMVKQQVETQIKVRDMSRTQVSIAPAEFASWSDARAELMSEVREDSNCTYLSHTHQPTRLERRRRQA